MCARSIDILYQKRIGLISFKFELSLSLSLSVSLSLSLSLSVSLDFARREDKQGTPFNQRVIKSFEYFDPYGLSKRLYLLYLCFLRQQTRSIDRGKRKRTQCSQTLRRLESKHISPVTQVKITNQSVRAYVYQKGYVLHFQ